MADALVHILGVIAAIAGAGILLVMVTAKGDTASIIAAAIFGFGFFASLTLSAAHNIVETKKWMPILKRTDQAAIYPLIACAFSPFALIVVDGQISFALLTFVWLAAIAGMVLNVEPSQRFRKFSLALIVMIGWALIGAADTVLATISKPALNMVIACVWIFSTGLLFIRWDALPFQNAIWRIFVLLTISCLYAAVFIELPTP